MTGSAVVDKLRHIFNDSKFVCVLLSQMEILLVLSRAVRRRCRTFCFVFVRVLQRSLPQRAQQRSGKSQFP